MTATANGRSGSARVPPFGPNETSNWILPKEEGEFINQNNALLVEDGGADRIRTCDLLIANETLYQLSYDPIRF
jgi:hypothetical protein